MWSDRAAAPPAGRARSWPPAAQRSGSAPISAAVGAEIVPVTLPSSLEPMGLWLSCITADRGAGMRETARGGKVDGRAGLMLRLAGMPPRLRRLVAGLLSAIGQKGLSTNMRAFGTGSAHDYWRAVEAQADFRARYAAALDAPAGGKVDLVLMPA